MLTKEVVSLIRGLYSKTIAREFKTSKIKPFDRIKGEYIIECDICGEFFYLNELTVHHVYPVIPPQITYHRMSYYMFNERLNCSWKNLQLLCLPCHQGEGYKEDQERQSWVGRKKQLVCRSKRGGKMRVNPLIDLKSLDPMWEIMDIASTRREADTKMRRWRKN